MDPPQQPDSHGRRNHIRPECSPDTPRLQKYPCRSGGRELGGGLQQGVNPVKPHTLPLRRQLRQGRSRRRHLDSRPRERQTERSSRAAYTVSSPGIRGIARAIAPVSAAVVPSAPMMIRLLSHRSAQAPPASETKNCGR